MAGVVGIVGDKVLSKDGLVDIDDSTFAGKTLGLYFSAHWCPPCRGFTPVLAEYYNSRKSENDFEIVFVSSDQSEAQFKEYFGEMPWKALPFSEGDKKKKLSEKYGIRGIPTLVLVNADTGETVCSNARSQVASNAPNFPWKE